MRTKEDLKMLQALPLEIKILKTQQRIREWVQFYGEDGVCVSFSGGKDSTVLLHLVRSLYPNVRAVFSDTGLEFPEIRNFVKTFDNVDWVRPKMTFGEIVTKYGYPLFSKEISNTIWYARKINGGKSTYHFRDTLQGKRKDGDKKSIYNKEKYLTACRELPFLMSSECCPITKKRPMAAYLLKTGYKPFIGTLAEESMLRLQGWIRTGCNAFDSDHPISKPLSFWTEQDILRYIKDNDLPICEIYGDIVAVDKDGCEYADTLLLVVS